MKKILYILRHGETNENKIGIVQGQGIDSSLNELGLWQASQFFKKYKNRSFDQIIASGQKRSYQTIEAFESNHQRIHRDIRINEISWGDHEGKAGEPDIRFLMHGNQETIAPVQYLVKVRQNYTNG